MPGPESRPLGILGGTFDPVHYGHLRLAEAARAKLALERVLWIPAGAPPHRAAPRTAAPHRLEMVRLAVAGNPGFALDDSEIRAAQPSYTVTTLERLRAAHGPHRPLVLLLGVDAFLGLSTWRRWRELFDLAHLAVANRPGYPLDAGQMAPPLAAEFAARSGAGLDKAAGSIAVFEMTPLAISATGIRAALACGESARYLLPDSVLDYIGRNRLYRAAPDGH